LTIYGGKYSHKKLFADGNNVLYTNEKEGTSVRNKLVKSVEYNESLDMMYMAKDGSIRKRRINVLEVGEVSFRAYCHLRKSKRTFTIDNVLALVPVKTKESMVI
jgi:predicted DNA-binding transcriptional regulator YafY